MPRGLPWACCSPPGRREPRAEVWNMTVGAHDHGQLKVAVLVDRPAAGRRLERDPRALEQSRATARAVLGALRDLGHHAFLLEASTSLLRRLRALAPDLVFNLATGLGQKKQQANVVALLEVSGVPFTGSPLESHVLALHKPLAKMVFRHWGIPTPAFQVFQDADQTLHPGLPFPLIVKPSSEGSSVGIGPEAVVGDEGALRAAVARVLIEYCQSALVEQFIPGREFTVGVLGNDPPQVLPPEEIVFPPEEVRVAGEIYGYVMKERDQVERLCPAPLSPQQRKEIEEIALLSFHALGCRDYARVDIRMDRAGVPFVLEVNTMPGLQPGYSELPRLAQAAGLDYTALVARLVEEALSRFRQAGGDGALFRCNDRLAVTASPLRGLPACREFRARHVAGLPSSR